MQGSIGQERFKRCLHVTISVHCAGNCSVTGNGLNQLRVRGAMRLSTEAAAVGGVYKGQVRPAYSARPALSWSVVLPKTQPLFVSVTYSHPSKVILFSLPAVLI